MQDTLIWKKITYPNVRTDFYMISENGDVMNALTCKLVSKYQDKDGYFKCGLQTNSTGRLNVFVHRLVAWEFVSNPHKYPVVDHLDGNKQNNHYTNLEWVTVRENTLRAERMGLRKIQGAYNGNSKYTEEYVRSICEKFQAGWQLKEVFKWLKKDDKALATDDEALYQFLYDLKRKQTWQYLTAEYDYPTTIEKNGSWNAPVPESSNYKYSEKVIRDVCKLLEAGFSVMDILNQYFQVTTSDTPLYDFIVGIRAGRNWSNISSEYNIPRNITKRNRGWDSEVADLVDKGFRPAGICRQLGIDPGDRRAFDRIKRMVNRYKRFKELDSHTIIEVV